MNQIHQSYAINAPIQNIWQTLTGAKTVELWGAAPAFSFATQVEGTIVHLIFSGEIEDEQKDIKDRQDYYFTPIKALLEARRNV